MTGPLAVPQGLTKRFFTAAQLGQVRAVFEAIWPGGANNPGATDVGAADYADILLGAPDDISYELRDWRPLYVAGLAMLGASSMSRTGKALEQLAVQEMTVLLTELAAGRLAGFPSDVWQQRFFAVLRAHCIEGCLADPRWGGNRDAMTWKWLGYPGGQARNFVRIQP